MKSKMHVKIDHKGGGGGSNPPLAHELLDTYTVLQVSSGSRLKTVIPANYPNHTHYLHSNVINPYTRDD